MPPEPFTPWSLAGILADGLDEMRLQPPFHLVGFSFGALLAGPLAVILAGRVATLTLVAASGLGMRRPPIALKPWRQLDDADERAAVHAANLARLMFSDPTQIDDLAIGLQAHNTARARIKSRPIARTTVLADTLPDVAAPLSAIYGERDAATPT